MNGATLVANVRRFEFVSPEVGWQVAQTIIVRLGGAVLLLIAVIVGIQFAVAFNSKRQTLPLGAPRKYGLTGGTICPKCHRPFSIHLLSFNLGSSSFDYCEHCGQWSVVKPLPREQLAIAERAELDLAKPAEPIIEETPEDKLRRQMEDSKYIDEI